MNDISTMYTKERNNTAGRKGYVMWKRERENNISPKEYGMFLNSRKRGRRK